MPSLQLDPARVRPGASPARRARRAAIRCAVVGLVSLLAVAPATTGRAVSLSSDVGYGGYFDDGALHVVPPNLTAADPFMVQGTSRVGAFLTAGSQLRVDGTGRVEAEDNSIGDAIGIIVSQSAVADVLPGGRIVASESSNGESIGVVVELDGVADVAGTVQIFEEGNNSAFVAKLSETGRLSFGGAATAFEEGNSNVVGFLASDSARVEFDGALSLHELGNGDAMPFHLTGQSHLRYRGDVQIIEDGNASRVGGLVAGSASALLDGGSLSIRSDGLSLGAPIVMLELTDQAFARITGGQFEVVEDGVELMPLVRVSGQALLRIEGSGFNHPYGLVAEPSGIITGTLADGQPLGLEFIRASGAAILLVPEPAALPLAALGLCGLLASMRTARRRPRPTPPSARQGSP